MKKLLLLLCVVVGVFVALLLADNPHNLPAAPVIVAQSDNPNQTTAISVFTLFTPAADGDYRLSTYLEVPATTNGTGTVCSELLWTDDTGSQSALSSAGISPVGSQVSEQTLPIHVKASQPIQAEILPGSSSGCALPLSYGVFWTVEKL